MVKLQRDAMVFECLGQDQDQEQDQLSSNLLFSSRRHFLHAAVLIHLAILVSRHMIKHFPVVTIHSQ
jgi:hypothetical protein